MTHSSTSLGQWNRLTTGRPDLLQSPSRNRRVAAALAKLVGCEHALLGTSTLHLFWDLCDQLDREKHRLHIDAAAYAIAHWGTVQAGARGVPVHHFNHRDPADLGRQLTQCAGDRRRPVVLVDGYCTGCGDAAPIADYLELVRPHGGALIIDDTQAIGIFGSGPTPAIPFGRGGGGSLHWQAVSDPHVVLISSLAKGFGVPLAVIAGRKSFIRNFADKSRTRVHCSPPSAAAVLAAHRALVINRASGEKLRRKLARLLNLLKKLSARVIFVTTHYLFPVLSVCLPSVQHTHALHHRLGRMDIRTLLRRHCTSQTPLISFIVTARHSTQEIRKTGEVLKKLVHQPLSQKERWRAAYAL